LLTSPTHEELKTFECELRNSLTKAAPLKDARPAVALCWRVNDRSSRKVDLLGCKFANAGRSQFNPLMNSELHHSVLCVEGNRLVTDSFIDAIYSN